MKKIVAMVLTVALVFPAASLLAQQAPASAKQPVQVAAGPEAAGFSMFGMSTALSIAVMLGLVLVVADQVQGNDIPPATATATATR